MKCSHCGSENEPGVAFCSYCGRGLTRKSRGRAAKRESIMSPALWAAVAVLAALFVFVIFAGLRYLRFSAPAEWMGKDSLSASLGIGDTDKDADSFYPELLQVDERYLIAGEENPVLFTAQAEQELGELSLRAPNGEVLGTLVDDGSCGDAIAADGIYSYALTVTPTAADRFSYSLVSGGKMISQRELFSFAIPAQEDIPRIEADMQAVQDAISEAQQPFLDEEGYVPYAQWTQAIEAIRETVSAQASVLFCTADTSSIYLKLDSGVAMVHQLTEPDTLGDGEDVELEIHLYEPHPDLQDPVLFSEHCDVTDKFVENILDTTTYADKEITPDAVRALPSNAIIFWNGHGGYNRESQSFLCIGVNYYKVRFQSSYRDKIDCIKDRIIRASTPKQNNLASVTADFIEEYCTLDNDLILLASCHSGQSRRLPDAFLNAGAEAVLGFTDDVKTGYALAITCHIIDRGRFINEDTRRYYSLVESLDKATAFAGENDKEWADITGNEKNEQLTAYPVLFGKDLEYRFSADPVMNNGGEVIRYREDTYYIRYASDAYTQGAVAANFTPNYGAVANALIHRKTDGTEIVLREGPMHGPIYLSRGYLLFQEGESKRWMRFDPVTKEASVLFTGTLAAVRQFTGTIVYLDAEHQKYHMVNIASAREYPLSFQVDADRLHSIGFIGDKFYYLAEKHGSFALYWFREKDALFHMKTAEFSEESIWHGNVEYPPCVADIVHDEESIYVLVGKYVGSGGFFQEGTIYAIDLGSELVKRLENQTVTLDRLNLHEGEDGKIYLSYSTEATESSIRVYEKGVTEGVRTVDTSNFITVSDTWLLGLQEEAFVYGEELLIRDEITGERITILNSSMLAAVGKPGLGSNNGGVVYCSTADLVGDKAYVTLAEVVEDPNYAVGWRTGFARKQMSFYEIDLLTQTMTLLYSY